MCTCGVLAPRDVQEGPLRLRQLGLAVGESADFRDHEDFSTLYSIKVFAIMKISLLSSD
jgi:hypothetical protein